MGSAAMTQQFQVTSQWSPKYEKHLYWITKQGTSLKFIGDGEAMLALAENIRAEVYANVSLGDRAACGEAVG